jgi:hypothetical protein
VRYVGGGSQTAGLQTNADGSVDLYTGPTPPPGKETNRIPNKAGGHARISAKRRRRFQHLIWKERANLFS